MPDTARDVFMAYRIRHGLEYPLEGPVLGIPHAIHFGPVWFYLLAAPLWIRDSWLSLAIFEGLLCGLKFPLAYLCGRKLLGARFGLLWAAALLLPGWSSLEPLIPFNPNAVGAACLAVLAIALRCADGSAKWWHVSLLGLAIGFALHVHPTTLPVVFLAAFAYRGRGTGRQALGVTVFLACGAAALFVPYLVSQAAGGWPDWKGASHYVESQVGLGAIARLPQLIAGEVFWGPRVAARYLAGWSELASLATGVSMSALAALPLVLAWRERRKELQRFAWILVVTSAALCAWLLVLRPTTPFYFTYVLSPSVAGLVALGIHMAMRGASPSRLTFGVALLFLAVGTATILGMCMKSEDGGGEMDARVLDVKVTRAETPFSDVWFPARHRGALGEWLCAGEAAKSLHGVLAYIEDRSVGLDALFACGRIDAIVLGGAQAGRHWIGLTKRDWDASGAKPEHWIGPLGIARVEPMAGATAIRIANGRNYFPRDVSSAPLLRSDLEFAVRRGRAIVVSNFLWGYERLDISAAIANDVQVESRATNPISALYPMDSQASPTIAWRFTMRSTAPIADVVALPGKIER